MMLDQQVNMAAVRKSLGWIALVAGVLGVGSVILLYQAESTIGEIKASLVAAEPLIRSATDPTAAKGTAATVIAQQKALLLMLEGVAQMASGAVAILFGLTLTVYWQVRKSAQQSAA